MYKSQGRWSEAEPLYLNALQLRKKLLGENHPDVATSLNNLAILYAASDQTKKAFSLMQQATTIENKLISNLFAASSQQTRFAYLKTVRGNFEAFLSLILNHLADNNEAVTAAFNLVLQRKSLTAAALTAQNQALYSGRYPHLQKEFSELRRLSDEIVQLTFATPAEQSHNQTNLVELQQQYNELERQLATQVPEIALQEQTVNHETVRTILPRGTSLIEFVCFKIFDFKAPAKEEWQPARYVAFIVSGGSKTIGLVDLGVATEIDNLIQTCRQSVAVGGRVLEMWDEEATATFPFRIYNPSTAKELSQKIFAPLVLELKGQTQLIFAPDGALNLLPWQIMPHPTNPETLLLDNYQISYLSCGRDLLRSQLKTERPVAQPLILADPDFDLDNSNPDKTPATSLLDSLDGVFAPAPGTRYLGEKVATMLGVKPCLGKDAVATLLTNHKAPRILLIATHGYFSGLKQVGHYWQLIMALLTSPDKADRILKSNQNLLDQELLTQMAEAVTLLQEREQENAAQYLRSITVAITELLQKLPEDRLSNAPAENPMLRSGLALAGANAWLKGQQLPPQVGKGFLFAQEVAGLDLWGNEITVLSACNTAMGDIQVGEGVFGLRRAFAVAGAKTLIMSLWPVPDKATALLMEQFFSNLQAGLGKGEALQTAQNYIRNITVKELHQSELGKEVLEELLQHKKDEVKYQEDDLPLNHPFYWGAWVCQGEYQI